jgi:hypothetical protein
MTIWVLTEEYNDYDQHGKYYLKAWDHKPSREELKAQGVAESQECCEDLIVHVLSGGGRIKKEYHWYILEEEAP